MKIVIYFSAAALFWGPFSALAQSSAQAPSKATNQMLTMPGSSIRSLPAYGRVQFEVAMNRLSESTRLSSGTLKAVATQQIETQSLDVKAGLPGGFYLGGHMSRVQGSGKIEILSGGTTSGNAASDTAGELEPTIELGTAQYWGASRWSFGVEHRLNMGPREVKVESPQDPKAGGSSTTPYFGLEVYFGPVLLGMETRYTIQDERKTNNGSPTLVISKGGDSHSSMAYIEFPNRVQIGLAAIYDRYYKSTNEQGQETTPASSRGTAVAYAQLRATNSISLIPALVYSKIMDDNVSGLKIDSSESTGFNIAGRLVF